MEISILDLGSFEITSGSLIISDPCYAIDIWCCNRLDGIRNGTWTAQAAYHDDDNFTIIRKLIVECDDAALISEKGEPAPFPVGVDSGQAGFFDAVHYRDDRVIDANRIPDEPAELWYAHCCQITLSRFPAGILPFGVVSSSGYGDGVYDCLLYRNVQEEVVRAEIIFVTPEMETDCDE